MLCSSTCPYKEGKYESGFPWSCDGRRKEKVAKIITNWLRSPGDIIWVTGVICCTENCKYLCATEVVILQDAHEQEGHLEAIAQEVGPINN
jgi:hypothetical protein